MRKLIVSGAVAGFLLMGGPAFAASPQTGGSTGLPSQSCEEQPSGPAGFDTSGFQNVADAHYAPISQYDVACFQVSQH
jgi:hypothetical protein